MKGEAPVHGLRKQMITEQLEEEQARSSGGRNHLTGFQSSQRIICTSMQVRKGPESLEHQIITIQLHTKRGRSSAVQVTTRFHDSGKGHACDEVLFTDVQTRF